MATTTTMITHYREKETADIAADFSHSHSRAVSAAADLAAEAVEAAVLAALAAAEASAAAALLVGGNFYLFKNIKVKIQPFNFDFFYLQKFQTLPSKTTTDFDTVS